LENSANNRETKINGYNYMDFKFSSLLPSIYDENITDDGNATSRALHFCFVYF